MMIAVLLLLIFENITGYITNYFNTLIKPKNNRIYQINSDNSDVIKILKEMQRDISQLKYDIQNITKDIETYAPIWEKAGDVYELVVASTLKELKGGDYSRPFIIKNPFGLSRLAVPKDIEFLPYSSSGHGLTKRVEKYCSGNINNIRTNYLTEYCLKNLHKVDHYHIDNDLSDYMSESEIDVRGSVDSYGDSLVINVAEVKSGKGRKTGIYQLLKRLYLLRSAAEVIYFNEHGALDPPLQILLRGDLYTTTTTWAQVTNNEINESIQDLRLVNIVQRNY